MTPILNDGESVRVKRARLYLPGDVVAYRCPWQNLYLVHRFLGYVRVRSRWKCLLMPDRGSRPDTLVDLHSVLGRVAQHGASEFQAGPARRFPAIFRYFYWLAHLALRRHGRARSVGSARS
jgi:hypothetical protein